jgi:SnoaL-like domain
MAMAGAGEILKQFYDAATARDLARARTYLADDLVFVGLFETYRSADDYISTFSGLLQITVKLKVKTIIAEGDEAAIFFELETKAPAEGVVLVAEWHQIKNGKIAHVESAFDGRPFAAMFTGGQP